MFQLQVAVVSLQECDNGLTNSVVPLESRNDHGRSGNCPEIRWGLFQRYFNWVSNHFILPFSVSDCHVSDAGPHVSREFKAEAWGQLGLTFANGSRDWYLMIFGPKKFQSGKFMVLLPPKRTKYVTKSSRIKHGSVAIALRGVQCGEKMCHQLSQACTATMRRFYCA